MIRTLILIVFAMGTARTAHADDPEVAREYFLAGRAAYDAGNFAAAALAFEQANATLPDPKTMFSLAQSYRQLYVEGHDPAYAARALELYEQYVAEAPQGARSADAREFIATLTALLDLAKYRGADVDAKSVVSKTELMVWSALSTARGSFDGGPETVLPMVVETTPGPHSFEVSAPGYETERHELIAAEGRLVAIEANLRPKPASLRVKRPSGAWVAVDGIFVTEGDNGIAVSPGEHEVSVGRRGRVPVTKELKLAPGGNADVDISLAVSPRRRKALGGFLAGGSLAVGAGGALAYALTRGAEADDLLQLRSTRAWTAEESDDYAADRHTYKRWRTVSAGLALGAVLTTSVATYFFLADDPRPETRSRLTPVIDDNAVGLEISGGF